MDEKICLIVVLCVFLATTFIIKVITDKYNAKVERHIVEMLKYNAEVKRYNEEAEKRKYKDALSARIEKIYKTYQSLSKTAQYYIDNRYVYDISPYWNEYNQKKYNLLSKVNELLDVYEKCNRSDEWREILSQVHMNLHDLEEEQKKFSQILNDCKQEEEKYKKAFAKYGPKTEEKDSFEVSGLFNGCTNYDSLHKRYKALMKVYHSDIENGDNEMATKINTEYERLKKKYSM